MGMKMKAGISDTLLKYPTYPIHFGIFDNFYKKSGIIFIDLCFAYFSVIFNTNIYTEFGMAFEDDYREFLKKYRIEFVTAALIATAALHIIYTLLKGPVHTILIEYKSIYNIMLMAISLAIFLVAWISYPKIYKFKILLSGVAVISFFICFLLIVNKNPLNLSVMNINMDFYSKAIRPPGHFAWKFLLTMLNINLLIIILAKSSINYETGKKISWLALAANIIVFLMVLELVAGNYLGNDPLRLSTRMVDSFNLYFMPINVLLFLLVAVFSIFHVEEEHNYGSIIVGMAIMVLYSCLMADKVYPVKFILPFMGLFLIVGIFVHWMNSLHHKAHYDPLLKIYNRQYMGNIIDGIADVSLGKKFSVFMCDIDHFKKVNDTHGHDAGDAVLYNVAQVIRNEALPEGIVCRYGGEEIIVFLKGKTDDEAKAKAEKIRKAVKRVKTNIKSKNISVSLSIGVAGTERGTANMSRLIKKADGAVYKAKKRGRNRVVMS